MNIGGKDLVARSQNYITPCEGVATWDGTYSGYRHYLPLPVVLWVLFLLAVTKIHPISGKPRCLVSPYSVEGWWASHVSSNITNTIALKSDFLIIVAFNAVVVKRIMQVLLL